MRLLLRRSAGDWVGLPARLAVAATAVAAAGMGGCASPGLPKPPSLQLPALVDDLAATRRGSTVELRFTLPSRTTDGLALKSATVSAKLCRALDAGPCQPLVGVTPQVFAAPTGGAAAAGELRDVLPAALTSGRPHLLTYRVELSNARGRSGGLSQPAFAVSGTAPPVVTGLTVQGSRLGTVLTWAVDSQPGEHVVLRREQVQPTAGLRGETAAQTSEAETATKVKSQQGGARHRSDGRVTAESGVVWLDAHGNGGDGAGSGNATLDTTAGIDEEYRYTVERRRDVQVGGKNLEMRSEASAPVVFTLHDVFPPAAPTELSVAGFVTPANGSTAEAFAVDLIWQPVDDPHLAGYNIYRQDLDQAGAAQGAKAKLNATLLMAPAFHDAEARVHGRYRYSVTALDNKGNESPAAVALLEPQ